MVAIKKWRAKYLTDIDSLWNGAPPFPPHKGNNGIWVVLADDGAYKLQQQIDWRSLILLCTLYPVLSP